MSFFSLTFLLAFLPLSMLLYYITPNKLKNAMLLFISVFFYFFISPVNLLAMIGSVFFDYFMSSLVRYYGDKPRIMKLGVGLSVIKTIGFIAVSAVLSAYSGNDMSVGVLVYTLCGSGYVIDLYRHECDYEKNFLRFFLYCSFFGKIFAGPYVKYSVIRPQLRTKRISLGSISTGIVLIIHGIAKKVILGDELFRVYYKLSGMARAMGEFTTTLSAWVTVICLCLGMIFTLGAFCDIARGLGQIFSFKLPRNVYYPLTATSITDFVSGLQATLYDYLNRYVGEWIRGGRRSGALSLVATLLVMALFGTWFGASFSASGLLWGLYLGIFILIERYMLGHALDRMPQFLSHIYTILVSLVSFIILGSGNWRGFITQFSAFFGVSENGMWNSQIAYSLTQCWWVIILGLLLSTDLVWRHSSAFKERFPLVSSILGVVANIALLLLSAAFIV